MFFTAQVSHPLVDFDGVWYDANQQPILNFSAVVGFHGTVGVTLIAHDGPSTPGDGRGRTDQVTLDVTIDAGPLGHAGAIYGVKWYDRNKDGVRQESEFGVEGIRIFADQNGNGLYNDGEPSTWTDANGQFGLRNLTTGTYFVAEDLPTRSAEIYPSPLPNSGFETGKWQYWETLADVHVVEDVSGVLPPEGTYQALITNEPDAPVEDVMEFFSGSSTQWPSWLPQLPVVAGSAIKRTVTVEPGATLSFDSMFLTTEDLNNPKSNDFAMLIIPELKYAEVISDTFFTPEPGTVGTFALAHRLRTFELHIHQRRQVHDRAGCTGCGQQPEAFGTVGRQLPVDGGIGVHAVEITPGDVVSNADLATLPSLRSTSLVVFSGGRSRKVKRSCSPPPSTIRTPAMGRI